jgi:hypothetical protein
VRAGSARDHRIADARNQLEDRLRQLTAAARPRAEYSVVHGELLAVDPLDEDRLALYQLTQHLSLTAGPLRLLDGDFADREFMGTSPIGSSCRGSPSIT